MQRNVLVLYKELLVAAKASFPGFPKGREYAIATVRGEFKKNKDIQSQEQLNQVIKSADERLRLLRQSATGARSLSNSPQFSIKNTNSTPFAIPPQPTITQAKPMPAATITLNGDLNATDSYKQLDEKSQNSYTPSIQNSIPKQPAIPTATNKLSQICKQQIEGIEYSSTVARGAKDIPNVPDQWPRTFLKNITK